MRLMHASGVHDFSLKDIQKPEYKRVVKIFSAVINFAKFREEKVGAYEEFVEKTVRVCTSACAVLYSVILHMARTMGLSCRMLF